MDYFNRVIHLNYFNRINNIWTCNCCLTILNDFCIRYVLVRLVFYSLERFNKAPCPYTVVSSTDKLMCLWQYFFNWNFKRIVCATKLRITYICSIVLIKMMYKCMLFYKICSRLIKRKHNLIRNTTFKRDFNLQSALNRNLKIFYLHQHVQYHYK